VMTIRLPLRRLAIYQRSLSRTTARRSENAVTVRFVE
jgi:hypothetical protein